MKISLLLIVLIFRSSFGLQDQFQSIDNMSEINQIEQKIKDFGVKKKSIIDQIKSWNAGASLNKVEGLEDSIKNFFDEKGELRQPVINKYIREGGKERIDPDYKMQNTLFAFAKIKNSFNPLFEFEVKFNEYQARTSKIENELIYNSEFNHQVSDLITSMYQKQSDLKNSLLILLGNIQNRKQNDFSIRKFFFGKSYRYEEAFIGARSDKNIEELYELYNEQKNHFFEEHEFLQENYNKLNQLFIEFYNVVIRIQSIYQEKSKQLSLMNTVDDKVIQGVKDLLNLRRSIADIISLYRSQITLIQNQRGVFQKIFVTARRIQSLNLDKKVQEAKIGGSEELVDDIIQADKDQEEALADAAEEKEDKEEAEQDAKDLEEDRRLGQASDNIEEHYAQKAAERKKRADARKKRAELRAQRAKDRERASSALLVSKKTIGQSETESPETYFKNKEFSDKLDKYAEGIEERIDKGEISLADVNDTSISEKIVKKQMDAANQSTNKHTQILLAGILSLLFGLLAI